MKDFETHIPKDEVIPHSVTSRDRNGRLFSWDGRLFRGIKAPAAQIYTELFTSGAVERLVEKRLLIETERVPLSLLGYDLSLSIEDCLLFHTLMNGHLTC